jgi:hypothetical protein
LILQRLTEDLEREEVLTLQVDVWEEKVLATTRVILRKIDMMYYFPKHYSI